MMSLSQASSGLKELDEIIDSLRIGDNVVWQVDNIKDYKFFVQFYANKALEENKQVIYMRFARHKPLLEPKPNLVIYKLNATKGFESFSTQVHNIITKEGEDVYYVFDCLSDLLSAWATDLMIGNFFLITCPYLYELKTVAYFAIQRNSHSFKTVARIREITQVLLDVYNFKGSVYIHPLKVLNRYSPTMFLPHLKDERRFIPITNSLDASNLFSQISQIRSESTKRNLDYWDRLFLRAEEMLAEHSTEKEKGGMLDQLSMIMITRDPKMLSLIKSNFSLEDLVNIKSKLIGTGYIGGKTVGMLLARKILSNDHSLEWQQQLEPHDSFYVGSDVFYTYLVQNGWWKLRMEQKTTAGYFEVAALLREKMLHGSFPEEIKEHFLQMIEYFGQSPIIVRSSSLLEDSFGNAFAGKYESIFTVNQGNPEQRFSQFEETVKKVFASTMNEDALVYRLQRGLEKKDEQMALLVQRVSGSHRKYYFFPDLAGVGVSYNTFVWKKGMDPKAGMLRLVFGLGTRAVNRVEGDYPRMVALDAPLLKPLAGMDDIRKFSQHNADILNVRENKLQTVSMPKLFGEKLGVKLDRIGIRDNETNSKMRELGVKGQEAWILTFDELLSTSHLKTIMQKMLKKLETIYQYPVEIEFTINFTKDGGFQINLLQCRPLQTIGLERKVEFPEHVEKERIFFQSEGNFIGGSISQSIKRIIHVDPQKYSELELTKKYEIARLIGKLNKQIVNRMELPTMLLGPGRWGTTTPSLGVSVRFSEINNITVLGEIADVSGTLMPELSFGTHFFLDLIETSIFYVALFAGSKGVVFNKELLDHLPNRLGELVPDYNGYHEVVKVYDMHEKNLRIVADVVSQRVTCFYES